FFQNPHTSALSQTCQDQLLTLRFADDSHRPMADRFSNQSGVSVTIPDFGRTESAPFYEPMYERLEAAGYGRNRRIRLAGYDARLTRDMDDFLKRTKRLIKDTYDFSLPTDPAQAKTSATLYITNPSTYMSAADPTVFGRREVVLRNSTTGKE